MATKQELQASIEKMVKVANNPKTSESTRNTLLKAISKAEGQLKDLESAEKLEKKEELTPKQEEKVEETKEEAKELVQQLKTKIASAKKQVSKSPAKKVVSGSKSFAKAKELAKKYRLAQKGVPTGDSDIERDAARPALPKGKRIAKKSGKTYYENRDNRIDRKQPPKTYPKLAKGGGVGDNVLGLQKGDIFKVIDKDHTVTGKNYVFIDYVDIGKKISLKAIPFPIKATESLKKAYEKIQYVSDISSDGIKLLSDDEIAKKIKNSYASLNLMAEGGEVKWQDAEIGDSAVVKSENKMGVIVKPYGRKFHLKFVDGTEKTYDANDLIFIKDDEYAMGGALEHGLKVGDRIITSKENLLGVINEDDGKLYIVDISTGKREMLSMDKKEYGGILQSMLGGVNADPRFDIYDTGAFMKKGGSVKKAMRYEDGGVNQGGENEYLIMYSSNNPKYQGQDGFEGNAPDSMYADSVFQVLEYLKENLPDDVDVISVEEAREVYEPSMMAKGGEITIEEGVYGKSAYIPYKGEVFLAEWTTEKPTKADTIISDKSFKRVDENSSLFRDLHMMLLKGISEKKVRYVEKGGMMEDGGLMKDFNKNFTTAYILQQQLAEKEKEKGLVKSDSYSTIYYKEKYYPIRYHDGQAFASKELYKDLRDSSNNLKGSDEKELEEKITAYFDEDVVKKTSNAELHQMWKDGKGTNVEKRKKKWYEFEYGGILQPMTGGVNADPRFDIYDTGAFMESGGSVPEGYHVMPDGTIMPDSAHMANGGKVSLEQMYEKFREQTMAVRLKIITLIGIDKASDYLNMDLVVNPFTLIESAVRKGFITIDEINKNVWDSAVSESYSIEDSYRDSGEGIGSSDMNAFISSMLNDAGIKVGVKDNTYQRMAKGGEVKVGDRVKSKSGVEGEVYESTGMFFKLKDKFGNKNPKLYSVRDFKPSEIKSMAKGGQVKLKKDIFYKLHYILVEKKLTAKDVDFIKKEVLKNGNKEQKILAEKITPPSIGKNEKLLSVLDKIYRSLKDDKGTMAKGGKVKFADKVASVKKSLLERKKVPKAVQKDYGKTFSPAEAEDSAKRIVGAQTYAERMKAITGKYKKGKKTKK